MTGVALGIALTAASLWLVGLALRLHQDVNKALTESEQILDLAGPKKLSTEGASTALGRRVRLVVSEIISEGREKKSIGAIAAGSMTHDFRTPVARASSRIEAALHDDTIDKDDVLQYTLEQLRQQRLVFDRLLTFVKLDTPGAQLPTEPMDLSMLVSNLAEDYELLFEDHDVALNFTIEPGIRVDGNAEMLQLSIVNVLENIRKYALTGKKVDINLRRYGSHCTLNIRDFGPGLSQQQSGEHASERFWQKDPTASSGFGLGLALVREIVSAHEGQLDFADAQPGLLVTIRLSIFDAALS